MSEDIYKWEADAIAQLQTATIQMKSDTTQSFIARDMLGHIDMFGRDWGQELLSQHHKAIDKLFLEQRLEIAQLVIKQLRETKERLK